MTHSVVIVQARMSSTRLPGKVMLELAGKTVLAHVLERCSAIDGIDEVCCATVAGAECDVIAMEAARMGATVFRGSEHDVLDRYYQAAKARNADVVMRVTSDCPLIDPTVCGRVLRVRREAGAEYACNNMPRTWPHGLDCEAMTYEWLARAAREATERPDREHVTPYIRNHPDARRANLRGPGGTIADHRWTLDTPADFALLQAIFERLPDGRESWCYEVPLAIVESEPRLAAMNSGQTVLGGD